MYQHIFNCMYVSGLHGDKSVITRLELYSLILMDFHNALFVNVHIQLPNLYVS